MATRNEPAFTSRAVPFRALGSAYQHRIGDLPRLCVCTVCFPPPLVDPKVRIHLGMSPLTIDQDFLSSWKPPGSRGYELEYSDIRSCCCILPGLLRFPRKEAICRTSRVRQEIGVIETFDKKLLR